MSRRPIDRADICRFEGTAMAAQRTDPEALTERVTDSDGHTFLLRPVLPEDAPAFAAAFKKLSPEDVRLRFFAPLSELSPATLARLTRIDPDREMAFVLCDPDRPPGEAEIYAVVRLVICPGGEKGEYAEIVRTDMKHHGLGLLLMRRIIAYGRARGLPLIYGEVLRENEAMLHVCRELGFTFHDLPDEWDVVEVRLDLTGPETQATASSIA
jgi:acetyltransferase